ncbi:MAG TPA: hypothetical protein VHW66_05335 [Stellaceae bacterium]|jgi:hypothetical protein|nr:hypothetical protein [Stellaceae bacterium]
MITGAGYAAAVCIMLGTLPALAGAVDTPECRSALDDADRLMRTVQERQMQFSRYDPRENCRLMRANLDDLATARAPMDRCLTAAVHDGSIGQIDAAIEQVRAQLISNCRR